MGTLLTVTQASQKFPIFTEAALRGLIRRENENGFSSVIKRIRGRVYLIESAFQAWLENAQ